MATMAASESSFSSETEGSSSKGASGKSQVSGKKAYISYFILLHTYYYLQCSSN